MKIEFDASNPEECGMVQRMFSPQPIDDNPFAYQQPITEPEQPVAEPEQPVAEPAQPTAEPERPPIVVDVDLDASGVPWDVRIHSTGKTQNNNGTWKLRRGVDKALVEQIKAELVGAPSAPTTEPVTDPAVVFGKSATVDWSTLCARVSPGIAAGTHNGIAEAQFLANHQLENVHLLANRPDLFEEYLKAVGA